MIDWLIKWLSKLVIEWVSEWSKRANKWLSEWLNECQMIDWLIFVRFNIPTLLVLIIFMVVTVIVGLATMKSEYYECTGKLFAIEINPNVLLTMSLMLFIHRTRVVTSVNNRINYCASLPGNWCNYFQVKYCKVLVSLCVWYNNLFVNVFLAENWMK